MLLAAVLFADKHLEKEVQWFGSPGEAPVAPWMFALAGQQHMKKSVGVLRVGY